MTRILKQFITGSVILVATGMLYGCGTTAVPGGGQAVVQPIVQPSGTINNNKLPKTSKPGSTGTTKTPSTTGTGTGSDAGTGTSPNKNGNVSGSTGANQAPPSGHAKPPSASSGISLARTAVGQTGATSQFVAVLQSIKTVLLPTGWTMSTNSLGDGSLTVRLVNPKDQSQEIVEMVENQSRDIVGCYSQLPQGAGSYVAPQRIVRFTLSNPSHPYPDNGIVANLPTGGSIRVDVFLPSSEHSTINDILNSFTGTGSTT